MSKLHEITILFQHSSNMHPVRWLLNMARIHRTDNFSPFFIPCLVFNGITPIHFSCSALVFHALSPLFPMPCMAPLFGTLLITVPLVTFTLVPISLGIFQDRKITGFCPFCSDQSYCRFQKQQITSQRQVYC